MREAGAPDRTFPRACRLTSRQQFLAVYKNGRRARSSSLTLFVLPNTVGRPRLGITVTRKVGGAVVRNRVKRTLREIFRHHRDRLLALDVVVNAHAGVDYRCPDRIERDFLDCFGRLARRHRR